MKLHKQVIGTIVCHLLLYGVSGHIVPIVVTNKCPFTIWPATAPNTGHPMIANGGFCLKSEQSSQINTPWDWSGRIWARTGCNFKEDSGDNNITNNPTWRPACQTGDCDGRLECNGLIGKTPATLVELTFQTDKNQPSFYDISLVDGYNLPVSVIAGRSPKCAIRGCLRDIKEICPLELQVNDGRGNVVACKSACLAFDWDGFCCRNEYGSPEKCRPSLYSTVFKSACPSYVSYAYDSPSPLVSCLVKELYITFCPAGWGHSLQRYASNLLH
ncbi:thaumatin-like protein isoform X2 [Spinacia oleracea]|uniref:Thaumatin-like protein isoform X2 n=1 Tax=Spinacia oleracea TaxID=3562 RepID=A0A9R0HW07_SPIOL|nr:thaumatin-like protein isoform X2 [Spinacia oleracea]